MRACESWVHQRDVPKLQLMVRRENAHLIAFYDALGYVDGEVVVMGRSLM
jgi:ribosomal protein S18 acetylase RimI-like enzyme